MREIDITKEPINCIDELIIDEEKRSIEATYELWMDVDKYFGTKTRTDSSIWVNFYTFWHLDNPAEITAQMVLNGDNSCEEKEWELAKEEKKGIFFRCHKKRSVYPVFFYLKESNSFHES